MSNLIRAFCIVTMVFGTAVPLRGDEVPALSAFAESSGPDLSISKPVVVAYSVAGVPEELQGATWEEWADYSDGLSEDEQDALRAAMVVTAFVEVGGLTIFVSSDGEVVISGEEESVWGEIQVVHNEAIAFVLQDAEGNVRGKLLWPAADNALAFTGYEDYGALTRSFVMSDEVGGLWAGEQTYVMEASPATARPVGGDLQLGGSRAWALLSRLGGAVGAIVSLGYFSVKCVKDGLWDSYDCSPGSMACFCNGCPSC